MVFSFLMRATWPIHLIRLYLICIIIGEEYELWISSLCECIHTSVTCSGQSGRDVKLTTHHLLPRLIIRGSIRLHPLRRPGLVLLNEVTGKAIRVTGRGDP
jgi:hypothetical protein